MAEPYPVKAVPAEAPGGHLRYVCTNCNDDPLRDPIARKWVDGPLRPPER